MGGRGNKINYNKKTIETVADRKKVGQCFCANVSRFTLSMVIIEIFIYLS
jgi:hypothetical protein